MGKGTWTHPEHASLTPYTTDEVARHTDRNDRWIVVDDYVYDVTNWARRHPGGEKIISGYAGQDASEAWYAFHPNKQYVSKFMKPLLIGRIQDYEVDSTIAARKKSLLLKDFHELRSKVEMMGLFSTNSFFYVAIMLHILFFDFLGWWTMRTFGTGWLSFIVASCFLAIAQIQAGWSQHDYGHLSVFNSSRYNHWMQIFVLNVIKGASCDWWNFRHYNHHAKPNVLTKDPDITLAPLFLVGNTIAKEYGKEKKKYLPYASQHNYFFFVLPPLLLPLYFNIEIPYFLIKRRRWAELCWMGLFFVRWQFMFSSMLGICGVFGLFLFVRFLESHWFVWATQMSHIPMYVDYDQKEDWVTTQVRASCNVDQSWFNDWWSGHLNFQIEHQRRFTMHDLPWRLPMQVLTPVDLHNIGERVIELALVVIVNLSLRVLFLFPTMPRHSYAKAAPLVEELCRKHGLTYQRKTLMQAFGDIVTMLKTSGEAWKDAYNM